MLQIIAYLSVNINFKIYLFLVLKDLDVTEEYEIGAQNDYTDFF